MTFTYSMILWGKLHIIHHIIKKKIDCNSCCTGIKIYSKPSIYRKHCKVIHVFRVAILSPTYSSLSSYLLSLLFHHIFCQCPCVPVILLSPFSVLFFLSFSYQQEYILLTKSLRNYLRRYGSCELRKKCKDCKCGIL